MYADVLPFPARELQSERTFSPTPVRPESIRLIRAAVGNTVRLIPVSEVICLEAADKYVTVVTAAGESQVRMPLKELATRLAGIELVQIHRSMLVNMARMVSATRDEFGHYNLTLRGLNKTVKVSRAYSHLFRPM
jgi:DNA-binding LytR/AlgR family response regulator